MEFRLILEDWFGIQRLTYSSNTFNHFTGTKRRGRYPEDLVVFDGKFGTIEDFVPKEINLRNFTSVTARLFDPLGKDLSASGW